MMSANADGTGTCDRCGVHLENLGPGYCIVVIGMTIDGKSWYGHFCTFGEAPCAAEVMSEEVLAHSLSSGEQLPEFFNQTATAPEPPDEPEQPPADDEILVPPGG